MPGYYDYVLGFVPFALVGIAAALSAVGVNSLIAIPTGAAVASLAIGHAIFVNAPVDGRPDTESRVRSTPDRSPINAD